MCYHAWNFFLPFLFFPLCFGGLGLSMCVWILERKMVEIFFYGDGTLNNEAA